MLPCLSPFAAVLCRNPFCGIFVKGLPAGSAVVGLDKHAQSKTIIRLSATFEAAPEAGDCGVRLKNVKDDRTLVTDILGKPKALAKKGGKLVFEDGAAEAAAAAVAATGVVAAPEDSPADLESSSAARLDAHR